MKLFSSWLAGKKKKKLRLNYPHVTLMLPCPLPTLVPVPPVPGPLATDWPSDDWPAHWQRRVPPPPSPSRQKAQGKKLKKKNSGTLSVRCDNTFRRVSSSRRSRSAIMQLFQTLHVFSFLFTLTEISAATLSCPLYSFRFVSFKVTSPQRTAHTSHYTVAPSARTSLSVCLSVCPLSCSRK